MLGYLRAFEEIRKLEGENSEILKTFFLDFLAPRLKAYEITLVAIEYMLRDIYANKLHIDSEIERMINQVERGTWEEP